MQLRICIPSYVFTPFPLFQQCVFNFSTHRKSHFVTMLLLRLAISLYLTSASAKSLVKYDASAGDAVSNLGLVNFEGWGRAAWPSGRAQNSSFYFKTATGPNGVPAAHVHKDASFTRAEHHTLKGNIAKDTTYYVGYKVRFESVDYQTFVWQWKNYDSATVASDNVPAVLTFHKNPDDNNYHIMYDTPSIAHLADMALFAILIFTMYCI